MAAIETGTIETARLRFHYRTHGEPDGLPLLFLHGSYGSSRWWESLFELLPTELYAVAPDLRGCGQSDKSDIGYNIEEQAADVISFAQALGLARFDLIGHSSGGAIAIELALTQPAMISSLTLVNSAPIEGVFTPVDMYMLLEDMRTNRTLLEQALQAMMPTFTLASESEDAQPPQPTAQQNRQLFDLYVEDAQQMAPAAFTSIASALSHWNRFAEAKYLTLPTLLLWGDQDVIIEQSVTTRMLVAIPGANNLEILRNVGHCPMIEAPETLAIRLLEFLTEDHVIDAALNSPPAANA